MGQTTEATWHICLQYAAAQIKYLEKEVDLLENVVSAIFAMEKKHMLQVKSPMHTKLFQAYKGTVTSLENHRKGKKKPRG